MTKKASGPVDYSSLWKNFRQRLLERYEEAKNVCVTEHDYANIVRGQGMTTAFGTAIADMETAEDEARGVDKDQETENA
jgi:hypothetical protein